MLHIINSISGILDLISRLKQIGQFKEKRLRLNEWHVSKLQYLVNQAANQNLPWAIKIK